MELSEIENGESRTLEFKKELPQDSTLDELELRKKRRYYDELPMSELEVTDSDIEYLCSDFSKRAKTQITKENLINMKLLQKVENNLVATKAYAIFLGKHDYLSRIQCARFKGIDRVHFIDKKDFDGPLLEQIDGAYKFVLEHINMAIEIKGIVHDEIYELPQQAIRELIINAVIHRNYMMSSSVQVAVYDDRVEISSPGSLYGSLTLQEALEGRSSIRNKILASVCEKLNVIEGWGSGLKRIIDFCKEKNVNPPEIQEIGDMLRVNFYRPSYKKSAENDPVNCPVNDPVNENCPVNCTVNDDCPVNCTVNEQIGDKLAINVPKMSPNDPVNEQIGDKSAINQQIGDKSATNNENKILEYLKKHDNAKSHEIADYIGLKISRTKDYLSKLVKERKIESLGENKNRTYKIKL